MSSSRPASRAARISRTHRLAKPEMVGAVERGQHAVRAVELLEVGEIAPRLQVHPPVPVHPFVGLRPAEKGHGLAEREPDAEHRAVFHGQIREERGDVAAADVRAQRQPAQRDRGYRLVQRRTPEQRAGDVVLDRGGDGAADHVHPADEIDPLLGLVVDVEHEAEDVARVDQADDDDVPGAGNLVGEERLDDARLHELADGAFLRAAGQLLVPRRGGQRPEIPVVMLHDADLDQAVQRPVDDRLRPAGEPFDPVDGVPLNRVPGDFLQDGIEHGIAGFRRVHEDQRFEIGVDPPVQREVRERGAHHRAVQIPARHLVEIAGLFVEEHQDELLDQAQLLGRHGAVGHRFPCATVRRGCGLYPVSRPPSPHSATWPPLRRIPLNCDKYRSRRGVGEYFRCTCHPLPNRKKR